MQLDLSPFCALGNERRGLRAVIPGLKEGDLDEEKIRSMGCPKDVVSEWLNEKYSVPLNALRPDFDFNKIKFLQVRGSKGKIRVPEFDSDFAYFLGVVLGDGHVKGNFRKEGYRRYLVIIKKKRTNYSEFVLPSLIESLFGIKPTIYFGWRKSEIISISLNSKVISEILTKLFDFAMGKKNDLIISKAQEWPEEIKKHFVAGLFDTDGGTSGKSYAFCNSSEKIALFVMDFLARNGIECRFYEQHKGEFRWNLVFIKQKYNEQFRHLLPLKNSSKYECLGRDLDPRPSDYESDAHSRLSYQGLKQKRMASEKH